MGVVQRCGDFAFDAPGQQRFQLLGSLGLIGDHLTSERLGIRVAALCASVLVAISVRSLRAASFTKSGVLEAVPRAEFTPVFSPTDRAIAVGPRGARSVAVARIT